ncbi:redoxin domain-containing protein [Gemmatimonas sp. UBA7669]|uniref:redoxin domain-containing protein n=1 Tax=Gemmatimonas sp. UBA7669 TaxID=1946568 RepID=UPI0025C4DD9C|nr:redoxin domain-containing protein [Gemmatimonas sp. UBA7669]
MNVQRMNAQRMYNRLQHAARVPRVAAQAMAVLVITACGAERRSNAAQSDGNAAAAMTAAAMTVAFDSARAISAMTVVGAAPILAIAPSGERATAWVSAPDGGTDGRLHVLVTSATDSAGVVRELRDPLGPIEPHGEAPPKLAWVQNAAGQRTLGALYVVGRLVPGKRFPASALRFVRSEDGGSTWSAPVTVTDDTTATLADGAHFGSHNFHALHGAPDGTFHVAWLDGRAGKSAVYTTHSIDGGRSWARNVRVVPPSAPMTEACPCCRTAIAADATGHVYLAWRAVLPADTAGGVATARASAASGEATGEQAGNHAQHGQHGANGPTIRDIVVARSTDRGATWEAPVRVHSDDWVFDGCPHAGPSLAVDALGTLHAAWWTGKPGAAGVFYTQSTDRGASFANATPLGVASASQPAHVQLAVMEGTPGSAPRVLAAWDDGTRRVPQVMLRSSGDGGATFGEAISVSENGPAASFPVLAVDAQRATVMVAWSQQAPETASKAVASRPNMRDPKAVMPLPSVGQTQVLLRTGTLTSAARSATANADQFTPLAVGDLAPAYGARVRHGAFAGDSLQVAEPGTVTLLNVWATWCTSCREEMADLDSLHQTYGPQGLRVLGVSVDQGNTDKVLRYVAREKLGFSVAHDPLNSIQQAFSVVGVPETYLIDGTGRVVWKTAGNIHGALPAARAAIERALAGRQTVRTSGGNM